MSDTIIKVERLSKSFIIGHQKGERYTALRDVISENIKDLWHKTKRIMQADSLVLNEGEEEFWALKDINFEIKRGERIGVIGRNGAGKSTLLKILSRIMEPSEGRISIQGRVASLLEVGTGFHPELSGRENIFLNGAILGMSRLEIKKKFDEIVAFAEVDKFIDTPVKRYSSGMYVRLAFAVAAHLEPDVLVVDEVLAVGDVQFQKKCLGKMEEVSRNGGRTILFVSHNLQAIRNFCDAGIYLSNGKLLMRDKVDLVIDEYLNSIDAFTSVSEIRNALIHLPANDELKVLDISLCQNNESVFNVVHNGRDLEIQIKYQLFKKLEGFRVLLDFCDDMGNVIFRSYHDELNEKKEPLGPGVYISKICIPSDTLAPIVYDIKILFGIHATRMMPPHDLKLRISVANTGRYNQSYGGEYSAGKLCLVLPWEISKV